MSEPIQILKEYAKGYAQLVDYSNPKNEIPNENKKSQNGSFYIGNKLIFRNNDNADNQ